MKTALIAVALILTLATLPVNAVIVKVEDISSYEMVVNADSGHVRCTITLRNLVNNPIVPGIGELRLQKQEPQKVAFIPLPNTRVVKAVNVTNVKAYSGKTKIPVKVFYRNNYTVIQYEIWRPIEPKGTYTFTLEFYAEDLIDKGILFKSVTIPVGADVDIEELKLKAVSNWHLTYTEPNTNGNCWIAKIPADHIAFFTAEFSLLPLPKLPVRGYVAFWGALIVLIVAVTIALKRQKNVPK